MGAPPKPGTMDTNGRLRAPSRRWLQRLTRWTLQPWVARYLRRPRWYRGFDLELRVPPGVFHPRFFFSSQVMAHWIEAQRWGGLSVLDVGCGSGLLGLVAARAGAQVSVTDISPVAVRAALFNAQHNRLAVEVFHSDLFDGLSRDRRWQRVIANPPWFRGDAADHSEHAWYAGAQWQWFRRFFSELHGVLTDDGQAYMVLADSADMNAIEHLAAQAQWRLRCVASERVWWEHQWIYHVTSARA